MARTFAWRSAAVAVFAVVLFACREETTAPGRCPELCPADSLTVVDTTISGTVAFDTSIRGYTRLDRSPVMVAASLDSLTAYAIVRFQPLPQRWFPDLSDTAGVHIGTIDSVVIELRVDARDSTVNNTRLLMYRLPVTIDTNTTFDSVAPLIAGPPLDSLPIPDSLRTASLHQLLDVAAFTPVESDSFRIAIAFAVRGDSATAAVISAVEQGVYPIIRYYVHGAAPSDTLATVLAIAPEFDSYVRSPDAAPPAPGEIVVGNQPAARAFLRFNIPSYYIDSVAVVRATLRLTQTRPASGFPGETYFIYAQPVLRYFAGKSLIVSDTTLRGQGSILVGQSGTVDVEMGRIMRLWRQLPADSLPRDIVLSSAAEPYTFAQIRASGAAGGANAPKLDISFVRPFRFGVP